MRIAIYRSHWLTSLALLFVIPSVFFVVIGVLSVLGNNGPLETIRPWAEKWGIKDPPGLNITSVILFGPMVAFLLVVFQFMGMEWKLARDEFSLRFSFYKRPYPIIVAVASVAVLAALALYMFVENCNCH